MPEQYTDRLQDLLLFAQREANLLGASSIELEHIALALLGDPLLRDGVLSEIDAQSIEQRIQEYLRKREKIRNTNEIPLSNQVKQALSFASEEAKRLHDSWIRTPHLLLGLMRVDDSYGTRLLQESGVSLEALRKRIAPASIIGSGNKWSEMYEQATDLNKQGFTIGVIKDWREQAAANGEPSGLQDFYRTHGICLDCQCTGLRVTGFDEETEEHLWSICSACGGTGRLAVS